MTSRQSAKRTDAIGPALLAPLLALLIIVPLLRHGPSCGHDFGFHMQSWMDAGEQLHHGTLLPHWAFSPAFNAGEPRFIFYPPLSWLLGSLLLLLLPAAAVTTAFTWIALTGAALAMYALAERYTSRWGALLAAAFYIGNPYIFFTAFERTAYAELLAAAWMPLLLRAALAPRPSTLGVAVPLALLWLTNAPAAVMGTYTLVLVVAVRALLELRRSRAATVGPLLARTLLARTGLGLFLGLALPAFYLIPAAWERRYVQIAMVIIPNMRVEDNFLFGHTGYGPHDQVLHTATLVTLELAAMTSVALALAFWQQTRAASSGREAALEGRRTLRVALVIFLLIGALLWPITLPVWHLLPELAFLQFPWRFSAVLGCVLGLGVALALPNRPLPAAFASILAVTLVSAATSIAYPPLRQGCEAHELPAERLALYNTGHGVGPTDEYTPTPADNDQLRWHDPAFWLSPKPDAPAPGTVPNPAATDLNYDALPPMDETVSGRAPTYLDLQLARPEDLILNLRDYPAWQITLNGNPHPGRLERDDGLLAVALPAGRSTLDIRWRTLPDVWVGDAVSLFALGTAGWLRGRSRKMSN